jgi:hypothetical protein
VGEEEAHHLEDAFALPRVDVADVAELRRETARDAGLLVALAQRGLGGPLACIDEALRERPDPHPLSLWPHRREPPAATHPPHEDDSGGELTTHPDFVTPFLPCVTQNDHM